jgi:hypothetical protein
MVTGTVDIESLNELGPGIDVDLHRRRTKPGIIFSHIIYTLVFTLLRFHRLERK